MGQSTSKEITHMNGPPVFDEDISIRRRRRMMRPNSRGINVQSISGLESGSNIDNVLSNMGVTAEFEESPLSDSSLYEEVLHLPNHEEAKKKVSQLYDYRLNRYKMRLSVMYPEYNEAGTVKISRIRTSSMIEIMSYLNLSTQLNLKSVNRYFRKLVKISHNHVSLDTHSGWIDAIHLSTFLQSITLVGEPKESDIKEFCSLLRNDGFMQLNSLGLYLVGEWVLIEILEALSARIKREVMHDILTKDYQAEIVIQENEFSPFFASRFAKLCNETLGPVLSRITFIVREVDGLHQLLTETNLSNCCQLKELDLHNIPLGRNGFEILTNSLWPQQNQTSFPPLSTLLLSDTLLTNSALIALALALERGRLINLTTLDLSHNSLTYKGMELMIPRLSSYLCPNLRRINLSCNVNLGGGTLAPWFISLSNGVCPLLTHLHINNCGLNETEIDALGLYFSSIFSENMLLLDIGNNQACNPSLIQFFQCLFNSPCSSLTSINLENLNINLSILKEFTTWLRSDKTKNLCEIVLRVNSIDQRGLLILFSSLIESPLIHLTLLDLSSNLLSSFSSPEWSKLISNKPTISSLLSIDQFDIAHNPCTDQDMNILMQFMQKHVNLQLMTQVSFEDNNISKKGCEFFLKAFPPISCELRRISITSLTIRCIGRELHAWMCSPAASHLRKLQLVNCSLNKQDLTYLINAMEVSKYCQGMRSLRLSGNHDLDDIFLQEFVRIYGMDGILPYLFDLDLSYTDITKVGATHLLKWFEKEEEYSLRIVNLSYIHISSNRVNILHNEFRRVFKGGCLM